MTVKNLLKEAGKLSAEMREQLAGKLLAGIDAERAAEPLSQDLRVELERRIEYGANHPDEWIPWETVKAELKARRRKRCAR